MVEQGGEKWFAGLDRLSTSELAERLPQYLGFDIWRARTEIGCPRIVITVDTHEKLAGGEPRGDAWLRTLVRQTPGALILIFGRDKLRWAELDDRWEGVLDQHLLGELSDADADRFLAQVPIPEEDIRARIVGAASGPPHYLDLAVSFYEEIRNAGETPEPGDFGTTPARMRERLLDHLPPEERRELFRAAYPESLSERLFLDLADAFLGGAGHVNWARPVRRSFMSTSLDSSYGTDTAGGRLVMHALQDQDQDQAERAEFFAPVHAHLFERYAARAIGEAHPDYVTTLHNLAHRRQAMGRKAEAEAPCEQAAAIVKTALGEAHAHAILHLASRAGGRAASAGSRRRGTCSRAHLHRRNRSPRVRCSGPGVLGSNGHTGFSGRVYGEARAARDLLLEALGPEAELVQEAARLIQEPDAGNRPPRRRDILLAHQAWSTD